MRMLTAALLLASSLLLGACTMPGAPDDATRLETGAGDRAPATGGQQPNGTDAGMKPAAQGAQPGRTDPTAPALPPGEPAPPMSDPLPPEPVPERAASTLAEPDRSCRTSADCAVKNVGSCCGAVPACVNTAARTDPAAVQAQCAREGRSSICGFKPVESCACVRGTCTDQVAMVQ